MMFAQNTRASRAADRVRIRALLAGVACTAIPAFGQLMVGPNKNVSRLAGTQAEGQIGINPVNPNNIFAMYNNLGAGNGMWCSVSNDGGNTWAARAIGTGSDGLSASIGDPSVSYDNFGNLFIGHLTSGTVFAQVGLSTNGGATFTTLMTTAGSTDQPTVTAYGGSAWVCFNQGGGVQVSHATVSGLGAVGAWSALTLAPSSNAGIDGSFGDICIGPGGRMAVSYQNASSGQGPDTIYMNFDPDGVGPSPMGPRLTITSTNVGGFDNITPQPNRTIDAEVGTAYDRSGGQFNGRLHCIYTDETPNESNNTDIMYRFSDNNGTTWSAPVKLNDDVGTKAQFLPRIAVDNATGHIGVSWYDCRNSAGNNTPQVFATASWDGGATWMPNVQVSAGTSSIPAGGFDFGDYNGTAMQNDVIFPFWADNSNSTGDNPNGTSAQDMYTARVVLCYANCDGSTAPPILNANDFNCFLNAYAAGSAYANCDNSSTPPVLNANDFQCFLNKFAAGCT
jgi:hypothetical protein